MLEQVFKLSENKTNVRTEVVAGITTFLTMAYIIFVNPDILKAAGMPFGAVFAATCVAAAIGCFLMAFLANYPIALAPGMGLNAYFAFVVVGEHGVTAGRSRWAACSSRASSSSSSACCRSANGSSTPSPSPSRWRSPPASACSWL